MRTGRKRFRPGIHFVGMPGFLCGNVESGRGFSPGGRRAYVSLVRNERLEGALLLQRICRFCLKASKILWICLILQKNR